MITLDDSWGLYRSPDGKYSGYFKKGSTPDGWVFHNTYYVSCDQFLQYYYMVDASAVIAASQTYEHFFGIAKSLNLDAEFEDITISAASAVRMVIAALEDDKNEYVDGFDNYTDWQNFEIAIAVLSGSTDFDLIVENNRNNEIISLIYQSLGLNRHNDIYEYELEELSLDGILKLEDSLMKQ